MFQATASELRIEAPNSIEIESANTKVEYLTIGQLGFDVIKTHTTLGDINISGRSKLDDYNKISGFVVIEKEAITARNFNSWSKRCDKKAESILKEYKK